jgi:hypothetical protein
MTVKQMKEKLEELEKQGFSDITVDVFIKDGYADDFKFEVGEEGTFAASKRVLLIPINYN